MKVSFLLLFKRNNSPDVFLYLFIACVSAVSDNSYAIENLVIGMNYFVTVRARNSRGFGLAQATTPNSLKPQTTPGVVDYVLLEGYSGTALAVYFDQTAKANGGTVDQYKVEWAANSEFVNSSSIILPITYVMQKIRTTASRPAISGTFTLSFGGYVGAFDNVLCNSCATMVAGDLFVRVSVDLRTSVPRGDFIFVGTNSYRICLSGIYNSTFVPVCTTEDPSVPLAVSVTIHSGPLYMLGTSLGTITATRGSNILATANSLLSRISPGDFIRVGDPEVGPIYRVAVGADFNSSVITLGDVNDPTISMVFNHQSFSGPAYSLETTIPIAADATALQLKTALEDLSAVGTVDVEREVHGNGFMWTVTFTQYKDNLAMLVANAFNLVSNPNDAVVDV